MVKNELEVPLFWDGSRSRFKGTAPATGMTKIRVNREEEKILSDFILFIDKCEENYFNKKICTLPL